MSSSTRFTKDPAAALDYQIDWSAWLGTDSIAASTWVVPTGITKDSDSSTPTTTTIWLSGGTDRERYRVTNRITTVSGRTDERTLTVDVEER